jgi:hypothetical protein
MSEIKNLLLNKHTFRKIKFNLRQINVHIQRLLDRKPKHILNLKYQKIFKPTIIIIRTEHDLLCNKNLRTQK